MKDFLNEPIQILNIPLFEKVKLSPISSEYKKIIWFDIFVRSVIVLLGLSLYLYFNPEEWNSLNNILFTIGGFFLILINATLSLIAYKRKAFCFRTHDAIYRSGILSETFEIIPYNRLQHVVLKRGWLSRIFNLASIKLFTASTGNAITIPGLQLLEAEKIKDLLMDKIKNSDIISEEANIAELETEDNTSDI